MESSQPGAFPAFHKVLKHRRASPCKPGSLTRSIIQERSPGSSKGIGSPSGPAAPQAGPGGLTRNAPKSPVSHSVNSPCHFHRATISFRNVPAGLTLQDLNSDPSHFGRESLQTPCARAALLPSLSVAFLMLGGSSKRH